MRGCLRANTGISLAQFEIKQIVYDDRVKLQIQKQQELAMAVATSRAEAEKAEQEKKTATAQGEARVTEAKYAKEQEKIRAVVDAEKDKAVAITGAERDKEVAETGGLKDKRVAELQRQAAEENKRRMILEGEGEAQKRKLIMEADGALTLKLDAYKSAMQAWAQAYSVRQVPQIVTGGGAGAAGGEGGAQLMMELLSIKAAKDLALDLSPGGHASGKPQAALPAPALREPLALPAPGGAIPAQRQ